MYVPGCYGNIYVYQGGFSLMGRETLAEEIVPFKLRLKEQVVLAQLKGSRKSTLGKYTEKHVCQPGNERETD